MMTNEDDKTWQGHWKEQGCLKKIFGEMPIFGPLFLEHDLWHAAPKSLHSASMFYGGVIFMSINPFSLTPKNTVEHFAVGSLYMLLGMWSGAITFHLIADAVNIVANTIKRVCTTDSDEAPSARYENI
jgi:hypothetical protein